MPSNAVNNKNKKNKKRWLFFCDISGRVSVVAYHSVTNASRWRTDLRLHCPMRLWPIYDEWTEFRVLARCFVERGSWVIIVCGSRPKEETLFSEKDLLWRPHWPRDKKPTGRMGKGESSALAQKLEPSCLFPLPINISAFHELYVYYFCIDFKSRYFHEQVSNDE